MSTNLIETTKSNAKTNVVFVISQSPSETIKQNANLRRFILLKTIAELLCDTTMPDETFVTQTPAIFIFSKKVRERINV